MKSMNNTLRIILVVVIILGMFVIGAFMESPGSILKIVFIFILLLVVSAIAVFYMKIKDKTGLRNKQKRLNKLLNGRTVEDVLAEAPYDYGHFQGDEGYRIWDKRGEKNEFAAFANSTLDAELWIVEKYLSENKEA